MELLSTSLLKIQKELHNLSSTPRWELREPCPAGSWGLSRAVPEAGCCLCCRALWSRAPLPGPTAPARAGAGFHEQQLDVNTG